MKPGARALGVAESYRGETSTVAGVVVRRDRAVEDVAFDTCTVGGTDATVTVADLVSAVDRPDVRHLLVAGIAPAWYNILDLHRLHEATDRPVVSVSFEESPGLGAALRREFDGAALAIRLDVYHHQPPRRRLDVDGEPLWVRSVGLTAERVDDLVRAFTREPGRPEPLRVARLAARGADRFRADT